MVGWLHDAAYAFGGRPPCGTWRPCMPPTSWPTNCRWKWNSWRPPLLDRVYGTSSCMSGSGDRQSAGVALKRNQRPSPTPWAASGTGTPVGGIPLVRGNARHPLYSCAPMIAAKPGPPTGLGCASDDVTRLLLADMQQSGDVLHRHTLGMPHACQITPLFTGHRPEPPRSRTTHNRHGTTPVPVVHYAPNQHHSPRWVDRSGLSLYPYWCASIPVG